MNSPLNVTNFTIDKNVPVPPRSMYIKGKWGPVIEAMDVGDSIVFPTMGNAGCLQAALRKAKFNTAVRKQENGTFRVWKLERK